MAVKLRSSRHARLLFVCQRTGLAMWAVVEIDNGVKSRWFEARRDYSGGSYIILEDDDYNTVRDFVNGR